MDGVGRAARACLVGCALWSGGAGAAPLPEPGPCVAGAIERTLDTITVRGRVACTLTDLAGLVPDSQLALLDAPRKSWLLRSFVFLEDGATLRLHGSAAGGDVDVLRIQSDGTDAGTVAVSAQWGTLDLRSTRVLGWNSAANAPHAAAGGPRAFLRALSFLDGAAARESTMNVVDSEVSNLGFAGTNATGLAWAVEGLGAPGSDQVRVRGTVTGSNIHDCHAGAALAGAAAMLWDGNSLHHNATDGWSGRSARGVLLRGNRIHDNGGHGVACSEGCSELELAGNDARDNGRHGLALDGATADSTVAGNSVDHNAQAGVALLSSHRNALRDNLLTGNGVGVLVSSGSALNAIEHNLIAGSAGLGLHFSAGGGVPSGNRVVLNVLDGNASPWLDEGAGGQTFSGNVVDGSCQEQPPSRCRSAGPGSDAPADGGPGAADGGNADLGDGFAVRPGRPDDALAAPRAGAFVPARRRLPFAR